MADSAVTVGIDWVATIIALDTGELARRHEESIGGHDQAWCQRFPVALGWLLRA